MSEFRSAIVKTRSPRRYRVTKNPKGVIYLPSSWVGVKVKVVNRSYWVNIIKRLHNIEAKLSRIKKEIL